MIVTRAGEIREFKESDSFQAIQLKIESDSPNSDSSEILKCECCDYYFEYQKYEDHVILQNKN